MYRYLLFKHYDYYPYGGMNDCVFKSNDLWELTDFVKRNCEIKDDFREFYMHYYDTQTDKIFVAQFSIIECQNRPISIFFEGWEEQQNEKT